MTIADGTTGVVTSSSPVGQKIYYTVQLPGSVVKEVERTLSWVNLNRRLKVRYERQDDIHQAFLDLGCALICWSYVQRLC